MMTDKEYIEHLSAHLLYTYFEQLDIEPLLAAMADDILWLGAGKDMRLSGYQAVSDAFRAGIQTMQRCVISNAVYDTQRLAPTIWLCQISSDLATVPDIPLTLQEYQRCTFIFRANPAARNGTGWELVYLNNSMAYCPLVEDSFFATEQGLRNYQQLHHVDLEKLSSKDRQVLYALLERSAYAPLDADTQELFLILSQFSYFSETQAIYMWRRLNAKEMLLREQKRHAFLYIDSRTQEYYFNPVYADYLRTHFSRQPPAWQQEQRARAARWFLTSGMYEEAIRRATLAHDQETILQASEKGGLEVLFSLDPAMLDETLQTCITPTRTYHLKGYLLLLLHACLTRSPRYGELYSAMLARRIHTEPLGPALRQEYYAILDRIAAVCAYPDVPQMTRHIQDAVRRYELVEEMPPLSLPWTFGSPSILSIYHQQPGTLLQKIEELDSFLRLYESTSSPSYCYWSYFIHGEAAYMTGQIEQANHYLTTFLQYMSPETDHLDLYISALVYAARLSLYQGDVKIIERYSVQIHALALTSHPQFHISMITLGEAYMTSLTVSEPDQLLETQRRLEKLTVYTACRPLAALVYDSLSLARHQYAKLIADATDHIRRFSQQTLILIYEYIFLAAAYEHTQAIGAATKTLRLACDLAMPDQLIMPFAEHTAPLRQTLRRLHQQPAYQPFIAAIQQRSLEAALTRIRRPAPTSPGPRKAIHLTAKEQQLAHLVSIGKTNKEIAQTLHMAEITVKKSLSRLYKKVRVTNRAALAKYIASHHVIH